ncbi:MAG: hypothetical protein ABF491_06000 [Acetobacter sp.]
MLQTNTALSTPKYREKTKNSHKDGKIVAQCRATLFETSPQMLDNRKLAFSA